MVVCQFYVRGTCKFGDKCKNEHPAKSESNSYASRNPFGLLGGGGGPARANNRIQDQSSTYDKPYYLDANIIRNDLAKELPQWILSAYGPGRNAPLQLFGGYPREQSFEEMRYRRLQLVASGNQQQAIIEAQELVNSAERQVWAALNDVDSAIKYIVDGENQHPNRHDVVKARGAALLQAPQLQGNNYSNTTSGHFPAFSNQQSGTTFGRPTTSFGKPSAPSSSFGHPSTLGQPKSLFGQPTSAFGQPAVSSQASGGIIGQVSSSVSTFGQPIKQSPFSQVQGGFPSMGITTLGPVEPPVSAFTQQINPFGQAPPSQPSNPFGQQPSIGNFGSNPPAFDKPALQQPGNPFSQATKVNSNPFASTGSDRNPAASSQLAGPAKTFNQSNSQASRTGTTLPGAVSKGSSIPVDAKRDSTGKLTKWKGKPVQYVEDDACYRDNDGIIKKIWFPDGPPTFTKAVELPDDAYDETTMENYRYLKDHGTFKDGLMPELPPRREWCNWNF